MCGIFGAIGNYNPDKVRTLCLLNKERGSHSTGIFNGKFVIKGAVDSSDFVIGNGDDFKGDLLIGHTRFATRGAVNEKNAHPFDIGNIIGVHNGIIYNFDEKLKAVAKDFEVDSEIIFYLLNKGVKKLLKLRGYWGLAWIDKRNPAKVFLSNNNGELHYAIDNGVLYFSSDKDHLKVITKAKIKEVPDGAVLTVDRKTLKIEKKSYKFIKSVYYQAGNQNAFGFDTSNERSSNSFLGKTISFPLCVTV